MELEPISDSSQWNWGFHTVGGRCRPERSRFSSPVCLIFRYIYIWNDPWTGDGSLSSPRGAGSIINEPQPIRDRPVGGIRDSHIVRGGINLGDRYIRVRSRVVGVVYM